MAVLRTLFLTFANHRYNCKLLRTVFLARSRFFVYLCSMIETMTILTDREWFLVIIGIVTYALLFVLTVQNSRRKVLDLQERLNKVRVMQNKGQWRVEGGRQYQREGKSHFPSHTQSSALKVWCADQRWSPNHCHQSAMGQGQKSRVSI